MQQLNKERIARFMSDELMSESVKESLIISFMKKREKSDVNLKAAQMIALELLQDSWKELEKVGNTSQNKAKERTQVGL